MTIALTIAIVLIAALLLVRLRLRVELSPERRIVFLGLGRTGPEIDFLRREVLIKLSGMSIKRFSFERHAPKIRPASREKTTTRERNITKSRKREFPLRLFLKVLPQCLVAVWEYVAGFLRTAVVERAEGEIEAGFGAPHITGQVYGCYQAALAIAPALESRIRFIPVWSERSFSGSLRMNVAWPVYQALWLSVLFIWRLPIRQLLRLAIGQKKGDKHVK